MRAVVQLLQPEPTHLVEPDDPASRVCEALDVFRVHHLGADRVEHESHLDAAPCRRFQRRRKTIRDLSTVVDIGFEAHTMACSPDRVEHRRKSRLTVRVDDVQRLPEVSGAPSRRARYSGKSPILGAQRGPDAQRLLILRDDERASDHQRGDQQRADDVPQ